MSSEEGKPLTDPKAMRALAHPVRMALLELLGVAGTLTATQASEVLGESPANCAFHLRTLARYGFAEEAGGGRGRERPWRAVRVRIRVESSKLDAGAAVAARTLGQAWEARWMERARQALSDTATALPGWEDAAQSQRALRFLTAGELKELGDQITELMGRYGGERSAEDRPADTVPVEMLFFGYPLTDLAALADHG
jgi:hypothetical protein